MSRFFKSALFPILIVVVLAFFAQRIISPGDHTKAPNFTEFQQQIKTRHVESATFNTKDNTIDFTSDATGKRQKYTIGYPDNTEQSIINEMTQAGVQIDVKGKGGSSWVSILTYVLPFVIFLLFWLFIINQMQGGGSKVMSFGKSRAKRMSVDSPKITFRDVAGVDEAVEELHEIKEFLENPKKFQALGARIPKGVLLYGPPGTGKTLLARAVAGEAGVPFFSISGSDFVEMFVGVGASRVRDLFEQAKQNSPCIIFMDEIDAVGRHRGAGLGGGHDEREQTLNQLLVEMDGFEMKDNIILIAATNRPDILDPALLRPGRFDRQIVVDRPDRKGRSKILEVHTRGQALGYTISMPTEDKFLTTRAELNDTMAMTLGGRAAEEIVFGEITTGASNDLEKVTATAKQMVMRFGMSERLGPRVFGHDHGQPFLGREFSAEPDYSDEIAREIDDQIRRIVESAHQRAKDILTEHRGALGTISEILVKRETIEKEEFEALLAGKAEEEVFGPDEPPSAPPLPVEEPAAERGTGPRPLPRPGLAGGSGETRRLDPDKPDL